jgi:hypothetical protein
MIIQSRPRRVRKLQKDQAPLHIENPDKETMSCIPKGVYKWTMHNPNARATPNYSIVEDLAQMPCAMSSLEVLQSFPSQRCVVVSIGVVDSSSQLVMKFDATDVRPHLPYHVSFQIGVVCNNILVKRIIVDEGASTCVMSLSCWKAIGSPELTPSPTLLTAFDGHSFRPHGMIPSCPVTLGGKSICVEVEVVDAPLDYNMLLGRSWTYSMMVVISTVFQIICFPHEGIIVTIDQVASNLSDAEASPGPLSLGSKTLR